MRYTKNMVKLDYYTPYSGSFTYEIYVPQTLLDEHSDETIVEVLHKVWKGAVGWYNGSDNDTQATRRELKKYAKGKGDYIFCPQYERDIAGQIVIKHIGVVC